MTMFRGSASKPQRIIRMDAANVYSGEPEAEEVATLEFVAASMKRSIICAQMWWFVSADWPNG